MTPGIQVLMREVERVRDDLTRAIVTDRDVDAALGLFAPNAEFRHLPAGHDGSGTEELRGQLTRVVENMPADLRIRRISRTVDRIRLVDEQQISFRHDRELPWLVPGVAATGLEVDVLVVSVVVVRGGRITAHRTLWDAEGLPRRVWGAAERIPTPADRS